MSINNNNDGPSSSRSLDVTESPRKRLRLEQSVRKSWSLTDRRTDHEVLLEMGVSILEPDDNESSCDPGAPDILLKASTKRKHDIENVNPNVNSSIPSPRSKSSPKSPRVKASSHSPGASKLRSPKSGEKCKPLQTSDQHILETTLVDDYLIDEETPLAQSVSAQYMRAYGPGFSAGSTSSGKKCTTFTPLGIEEELPIPAQSATEPPGADAFSVLSDEMMLSVFRWLPKRTLAHCMLVCKRWHQVACDETLWQRLDLGNKTLAKEALGRILARKPAIIRLASSEISEWHPTTSPTPSRIQYLDLSMCTIDDVTLNSLLERCPGLKKLSLESVQVTDRTCKLIGQCVNLETLNVTMAQGITTEGLTSILEGCKSLLSINISWCNLTEASLQVLVSSLPQRLQRLNMGGSRIMTDDMVRKLATRCPRLMELDVSDCPRLGARAVAALLPLARLEHLALSRCYQLPPHVLTKLGSMPALQYLEVWGMLPGASLAALRSALPAVQINQFMFSAIARPTVGTRRTSIWGFRTRD